MLPYTEFTGIFWPEATCHSRSISLVQHEPKDLFVQAKLHPTSNVKKNSSYFKGYTF
jgi:hypothetical protein